jgi:hypothetical protein
MPNKINRDKRNQRRVGRRKRRIDSVKDLLGGSQSHFQRIKEQQAQQAHWRGWLDEHLPAELAREVSGVVEREGMLVVFAASAAWSARVRFALADCEPDLRRDHPAIERISVRVLPR